MADFLAQSIVSIVSIDEKIDIIKSLVTIDEAHRLKQVNGNV